MGKIWQANQNKTKTTIKSNGYIGPVLGHVQKCGNDKLVNRILTLSSWWVDRRHLPPLGPRKLDCRLLVLCPSWLESLF
jgi:hypothetical protein